MDGRYTNKDGNPVRIRRIPMSTGKKKFKKAKASENAKSPFDRFRETNGGPIKSL